METFILLLFFLLGLSLQFFSVSLHLISVIASTDLLQAFEILTA